MSLSFADAVELFPQRTSSTSVVYVKHPCRRPRRKRIHQARPFELLAKPNDYEKSQFILTHAKVSLLKLVLLSENRPVKKVF